MYIYIYIYICIYIYACTYAYGPAPFVAPPSALLGGPLWASPGPSCSALPAVALDPPSHVYGRVSSSLCADWGPFGASLSFVFLLGTGRLSLFSLSLSLCLSLFLSRSTAVLWRFSGSYSPSHTLLLCLLLLSTFRCPVLTYYIQYIYIYMLHMYILCIYMGMYMFTY